MDRGVRLAIALALAATLPALSAAVARAGTITVTSTADSGAGSLRAAIATAAPGETIVVPAGTITLTSGELKIAKSLTIDGAGPEASTVSGDGKSRVFAISGEGSTVLLAGLEIREGLVVQPGGEEVKGGGVDDEGASLTLRDAVLADNRADADGGPKEASAGADGGAIYASGPLALANVTLEGNEASAAGDAGEPGGQATGGAVDSNGISLQRVTFAGNVANAQGGSGAAGGAAAAGAINAVPSGTGAQLQMSEVELRANTAEAIAGAGAGGGSADEGAMHVFSRGPAGSISGLTASENVAIAGGSGSGAATAEAGGIELKAGELAMTLTNATITDNTAQALGPGGMAEAGGLEASANVAPVTIASSTIDANRAEGAALASGGDLVFGGGDQVRETIVSGGTGQAGRENCYASGPAVSLGHNLDSRNECGFNGEGDRVDTEPQLGPLQGNGGSLPTQAPAATSPARDAGATSGCPATDERGVRRPQGPACDIGAFELAPPSASTEPASGVTAASATLNGIASNPDVLDGSVFFQYGTTTAYGSQTPPGSLPSALIATSASLGGAPGGVSEPVTGLAPGSVYHFRAVAVTPEGTAYGADATFTTTRSVPSSVPPRPVLTSVRLRPSSLKPERGRGASIGRTRRRRGAALTYRDSVPATVTFTVQRAESGFRSGKSCAAKAPRRHRGAPRRCTRYVRVGGFSHTDSGTAVSLRFTGRVADRPLAVGRYRLLLAPKAGGQAGATVTLGFRIVH